MKRSHSVYALLILLALTLGTARNARSQNTATLTGVVTDPQGGTVKAAKVTLTNKSTGAQRTTVAGDEGRYTFVSVSPEHTRLSRRRNWLRTLRKRQPEHKSGRRNRARRST